MGYSWCYMQFLLLDISKLYKVRDLAYQIWNDHYPSIIGQEQVDYMLNEMYDLASLERQFNEGDKFYLVTENTQELGFASISMQEDGGWYLNKLYVNTKNQRGGIGCKLLDHIIASNNIKILRLQVNRQNYKAINFYFKYGFVIEKIADFDIGNGYFMNDFIMIWNKS